MTRHEQFPIAEECRQLNRTCFLSLNTGDAVDSSWIQASAGNATRRVSWTEIPYVQCVAGVQLKMGF